MSERLDDGQKKYLLALAREAITAMVMDRKAVAIATEDPVMRSKRGAFVTLNVHGRLRGCIGYPLPVKPLAETVAEMAVAAATQDYRFPPVEAAELRDLTIEISVLTLPRAVRDPHDVLVGKHGIIISKGARKGLLLPQVPLEYGWDLETYLRHGCLKAGLPAEEWKKGVGIEVFEAQVFGEES
jgi:AmmeMemoRadiSam system protein A